MEKTRMHGAKESHNMINETAQRSQSGQKEPQGAKLFQEAPFRKRSIAALRTRCSQTSQPLWNEVSIAVRVQPE